MTPKPLYQRVGTIGANVKPGHIPGSFSKPACIGKNNSRRARQNPSAVAVKQAAEETLVRLGAEPGPTGFDGEFNCRNPKS